MNFNEIFVVDIFNHLGCSRLKVRPTFFSEYFKRFIYPYMGFQRRQNNDGTEGTRAAHNRTGYSKWYSVIFKVAHQWSKHNYIFYKDCKNLITGSRDNSVKLWDTESGKCLATETIAQNLVKIGSLVMSQYSWNAVLGNTHCSEQFGEYRCSN